MVSLCWFRRDLRLDDHHALEAAHASGYPVVPIFIFDTQILEDLDDRADSRVSFIRDQLQHLQNTLQPLGASFDVFIGTPLEAFAYYVNQYAISAVFANEDYEPYARQRDSEIASFLAEKAIPLKLFADQVICPPQSVLKDNGEPYTVFTPYYRKWLSVYPQWMSTSKTIKYNWFAQEYKSIPSLASLGFLPSRFPIPRVLQSDDDWLRLRNYDQTRDIPGLADGTTRVGIHLRFGTLSIRSLVEQAAATNATFLKELVWREFYQMILFHFPQVVNRCFQPAYEAMPWRNVTAEFDAWCNGQTGYPLVDAGMRQLRETGFMHNRVRMVVASFLCKHLLIDWRWGEAYFASLLLDYELASNNGGWQWAAGCGCDAAPYFRIFNPSLQQARFDPQALYIQQWVPEWESAAYKKKQLVDHAFARQRALDTYKACLQRYS